MKIRPCLTAAVFLLLCGTIRAGDWPGWRGPTGAGITDEKDLPLTWGGKKNDNVLWRVKLEGRGYSSPIVWKDRVFVTTTLRQTDSEVKNKATPEHRVACYQAAGGKNLWTVKVPAGPYRTDNYTVPTPATDGQRVYVWFGSAVLAALDFDGKLLWRREWKGPFFLNPAMSSSPVVYKDSVILLCAHNGKEDSFVRAVDVKTGEDKWVKPRPSSGTNNATPLLIDVNGKPQLIVSLTRGVEGMDPDTGAVLWKCPSKGFVPSPAYGAGLLYTDCGVEGPGEAIDPTGSGDVSKTNIKWTIPKLQWSYASPVISGDYLYRASKPGIVTCWRISTGEEVFTRRLDGVTPLSSPIATADGRIYFACAAKSHVLKAGPKFEVLATNILPAGDDGPSPAVSGGRLFLKSSSELFCIGKKSRSRAGGDWFREARGVPGWREEVVMKDLPREIHTDRLCLRPWLQDDRVGFARLNADPRVVEFLPGALSREESDAVADRIEAHFQKHGFGLWAVEIPGITRFAGFIGLAVPRFEASFTPCIEIGWRLDAEHWNQGYATEGARAALEFGFRSLQLDEIVSFTVPGNVRSRRVMERIGMTHSASEDFEHPMLPDGHPLRPHVLYRLARTRWVHQGAQPARERTGP